LLSEVKEKVSVARANSLAKAGYGG